MPAGSGVRIVADIRNSIELEANPQLRLLTMRISLGTAGWASAMRRSRPISAAQRNDGRRLRRLSRFERRPETDSVAPYDIYGSLAAVLTGNRDGLGGAGRHIRPIGRRDGRWVSMRPIPRDILGIGVADIARSGLRSIHQGFADRRPVGGVRHARPDGPNIVSPVMPERLADERVGNRTRWINPSTKWCSRAGERLVRGKHKRNYTERRDKRPIPSIRHDTHQFVDYRALLQRR